MNPKEIFERYVGCGLMRNAAAQAALFTADGVYEAPLLPPDSPLPRRLEGHDQLRDGFTRYHQASDAGTRRADPAKSRYELHTTADPAVFIAEIDATLTGDTDEVTMSLVQIFRIHDDQIALLRDYFRPL